MDELMMTSLKIVPIMAEARKYHILGVAGESKRFKPRVKASRIDTLVSLGGMDRIGGYNSSYVESWNPITKEWRQLAKLPQNFVTFANTEYSVCAIKNQIIVTGGRNKQHDVWIYQVIKRPILELLSSSKREFDFWPHPSLTNFDAGMKSS